jgi:segregation and condensation protein A
MSEYRVRFEVFEGPLDLLLHLIRKEEVDIYEVNLTKIATEFIDYLNLMRELDLDVAGEFVVMAATLMLIKSRELLPRDKRPEGQGGEEDEAEDPRWELIRQLVEYRKFKDAAGRLQDYEERVDKIYPRIPGRIELPEDKTPRRSEATLLDLLSAVNAVLKRFSSRGGEARDVFEDRWTVSEKIEVLVAAVRERRGIRFTELFDLAATRTEVVVTFLAVLELIRLRLIVAAQSEAFAEIVIDPAPPRADETAAAAGAGNGVEIREGSGEGPAAGDPGRGDGGGNGNGNGDGDGALPPVDGDAPPRTELPPDDTHESRWN